MNEEQDEHKSELVEQKNKNDEQDEILEEQ
jgi:hypothetical protein